MDASHRGLLLNRLADAIERDSAYLAVSHVPIMTYTWSPGPTPGPEPKSELETHS